MIESLDGLLGTTWPVFIGMTVVVFGGAAFMTGQALARGWQTGWRAVPYCLLLGAGERFLTYALYDGELWSVTGYVLHTSVLLGMCLFAYRLTKARKMVSQYPWLYRRSGLFSWKEKTPAG